MKLIFKGIRMPEDLIKRIEDYKDENYLSSFTQAVIQLIVKSLDSNRKEG